MKRGRFQEWLLVLSGRSSGAASVAAAELGVDEERRCPRCDTPGAVSRGRARGLRRYRCKGCGRTFNAVTGTPLSGLHHKDRQASFGDALATGETVKASAERCGVSVGTAFRRRHRFLGAVAMAPDKLKGIVEADETYVLESRKGERTLKRKARRRGGKASRRGPSREQVPVSMAAARGGATVGAVLPAVTADALRNALEPAVAKDILLLLIRMRVWYDGFGFKDDCGMKRGRFQEWLFMFQLIARERTSILNLMTSLSSGTVRDMRGGA